MKRQLSLIIFGSALVISVPQVSAGTHTECSGFGDNDSYDVSRAIVEDLSPWATEVTKKISCAQNFKEFEKLLQLRFSDSENVVCSYTVNRDGVIENLRIGYPSHSSGSKDIDAQALSLVQSVGPLPKPPNNIASVRGMRTEFVKLGSTGHERIIVGTFLNPLGSSKQFQLESYLPADAEHPWRKTVK